MTRAVAGIDANGEDDLPFGLGEEAEVVAGAVERCPAWSVTTDELCRRTAPGNAPDEDTGVAEPLASLGDVGGEARFCWSMVEAGSATVLGFAEEARVSVLGVVADVGGSGGSVCVCVCVCVCQDG